MAMTIGLAEAKARLSEILDRVETGETIIISRNGRPVAELRPLQKKTPAEVVAAIRAFRERSDRRHAGEPPWPAAGERLRDVIHRGHPR